MQSAQIEDFVMRSNPIKARKKLLERTVCEIFTEALRAGRVVRLRVNGSSMLPSVWPHDTLVVSPLTAGKPLLRQLVLVERHGRLIAHRVVAYDFDDIGAVRFVTRGDALTACDDAAPQAQILGVVNTIIRRGRQLAAGMRQPCGMLAFMLRNSQLACRMTLKIHAILLRLARSAEPEC